MPWYLVPPSLARLAKKAFLESTIAIPHSLNCRYRAPNLRATVARMDSSPAKIYALKLSKMLFSAAVHRPRHPFSFSFWHKCTCSFRRQDLSLPSQLRGRLGAWLRGLAISRICNKSRRICSFRVPEFQRKQIFPFFWWEMRRIVYLTERARGPRRARLAEDCQAGIKERNNQRRKLLSIRAGRRWHWAKAGSASLIAFEQCFAARSPNLPCFPRYIA
jgi:hypothetical protein